MIASLIVTLDRTQEIKDIIDEISKLPGVEIGAVRDASHRLPITIDSSEPDALEVTTRRVQECRGVAFVDVVFVHLEQVKN